MNGVKQSDVGPNDTSSCHPTTGQDLHGGNYLRFNFERFNSTFNASIRHIVPDRIVVHGMLRAVRGLRPYLLLPGGCSTMTLPCAQRSAEAVRVRNMKSL
jgi:hypothetical protein